jgi:general secretion pathway protein I
LNPRGSIIIECFSAAKDLSRALTHKRQGKRVQVRFLVGQGAALTKQTVRLRGAFRRIRGERGFSLIEALVALAVVAAGLAAIGNLGFSSLLAARHAETRLVLAAIARTAYASLPDAKALGGQSGQIDRATWRLRASPFSFDAPGAPGPIAWTPQAVRLVVTGSAGGEIVVDTIRLRPLGAAR